MTEAVSRLGKPAHCDEEPRRTQLGDLCRHKVNSEVRNRVNGPQCELRPRGEAATTTARWLGSRRSNRDCTRRSIPSRKTPGVLCSMRPLPSFLTSALVSRKEARRFSNSSGLPSPSPAHRVEDLVGGVSEQGAGQVPLLRLAEWPELQLPYPKTGRRPSAVSNEAAPWSGSGRRVRIRSRGAFSESEMAPR